MFAAQELIPEFDLQNSGEEAKMMAHTHNPSAGEVKVKRIPRVP